MFQGLSTALTSLYANQQALNVTGNNLANVNTEGYSRQQVIMSPRGNSQNAYWSKGNNVGMGVNVNDISRIRDQFLDARSLTEHGTKGNLDALKATFDTIELTFKEPSDTGIQKQLSNYWAAWDDLANGVGANDNAMRIQVVESAKTLVTGLQQASSDLDELSESTKLTLRNSVTQLNSLAKSIADLNQAIQGAYQSGSTPNDMLDQRDLLVSKVADLAGVTVKPTQNGSVSVLVGGVALVRDSTVRPLQVDETSGQPVLRWDGDHNEATTNEGIVANVSGKIGGLLTSVNTTIPKYKQLLDDVATNLIATVNAQHAAGVDKSGNPGGPFFTGTSAQDIDVDAALQADPTLLAAAQAGGAIADGENARAMANLGEISTGPDNEYSKLINTLGTESQRTTNQAAIQTGIVETVDAARDSVSGVSVDEEMINMIRYQKAYSASARYLSVLDEVLDALIGIV